METILVVEDDKSIAKILSYSLGKDGYRVVLAADGDAALSAFRAHQVDFVILDVMLPKVDGFDLCRKFRAQSQVPILMLTAKREEVDRILGLELGADDYVTKPFSVRELAARIKAIRRRRAQPTPEPAAAQSFRAGKLEVDFERYETRVRGESVALTPKEFEFLKCLALADGKALSRNQLLEKVWGYDESMEIDTNTVDQHIARLRGKLGPESGRLITVKNVGYRLKPD